MHLFFLMFGSVHTLRHIHKHSINMCLHAQESPLFFLMSAEKPFGDEEQNQSNRIIDQKLAPTNGKSCLLLRSADALRCVVLLL